MIRRGEGGGVEKGGPLWSPGAGDVIAFPLPGSAGNRTRAESSPDFLAIKALLTTLAPTDVDELFLGLMPIG